MPFSYSHKSTEQKEEEKKEIFPRVKFHFWLIDFMICSRGSQDRERERKENSSFILLLLFNSFTYHIECSLLWKKNVWIELTWLLLRYCSSFSIFVYKSFKSKGFGHSQNFFYMCLHPRQVLFETCKMFHFFVNRHQFPTHLFALEANFSILQHSCELILMEFSVGGW